MELQKVINERISVRAFTDREVSDSEITEIVRLAARAPSWKNAQGYRVVAVRGDKKSQLGAEMRAAALAGEKARPDLPYDDNPPTYIKKRMFDLGMSLYTHMGIDRKDKERREAHALRNFDGFDAPVWLFVYMPRNLASWTILDIGIFLGQLTLAATDRGLGTCLQAMMASYPDIVAKYARPSADEKLVLGISLGYPDYQAQENGFRTIRAPIEEVLTIIKE